MPEPTAERAAHGLTATLSRLRRDGRMVQARELLARGLAGRHDPRLAFLAWQHAPFWWQPVEGRRAGLFRRGPDDAELVRRCWADAGFMARFNRQAAALPASDDALQATLAREYWALAEERRAVHWTIRADGRGIGFVSLVDIGFGHRRAEFLIGVLPGTSSWIAAEAAHLALQFAARCMKLERLVAHFYPENTEAIRSALKLGFTQEGVLRGHLRDRVTGRRSDLVVAGLLLDDAFFQRAWPIRRRLLGAAAEPIC